jgi:hypothetical protein
LAWNFTLECTAIRVNGDGQWEIDAQGRHSIRTSLSTDSIAQLLKLENCPALVGLYEGAHPHLQTSTYRLHDDDRPLVSEFSEGKHSAIAIASYYPADESSGEAVGVAVFYQSHIFASIKELTALAIEAKLPLSLCLDFIGFGRRMPDFFSPANRRNVAAGVHSIGILRALEKDS